MPKSDLFSPAEIFKQEKHVFSVSEITCGIKEVLEGAFGEVWVEGEISNFRGSAAGHFYPSLKDRGAVLQLAIFSRVAKDIKFKLHDGLEVICFGRIEVYPPRGSYQLIVEKIEPKGIGSLQLALEQLKEKLEKEGLFSPARKRPIPYLPGRIGVVTSAQGAAIKDILKVLDRRFGDAEVIISPVRVQGELAKDDIAAAIKDFNRFNEGLPAREKIEVMIVGRGGGSIEDLWAFNEEIVARAIYSSRIPVISAVGHERDVTIADLVADYRASTPSVAAEMVMPQKEELRGQIADLRGRLNNCLLEAADNFRNTLDDLAHRLNLNVAHALELNANLLRASFKKLTLLNPVSAIQRHRERILDLQRQIGVRIAHFVQIQDSLFKKAVEKLSSLSPLNILGRGYSITLKMPQAEIIKEAGALEAGDVIKTRLHKGELLSQIKEVLNG